MIKAVIFDMDGLLIDSEPLWKESEIQVFSGIGISLTLEMAKETTGMREDEAVDHWYRIYKWKAPDKHEVYRRIIEKVLSLISEKGEARKGVQKVMEIVKNRKLPMAIASSSSVEVINAVVEKLGIKEDIDIIHSAEHEKHGKPYPDVYLTASTKLKITPEYCLAFEDTPKGLEAAKAAKMKCVVVPDEFMKGDKTFEKADLILDSLEQFDDKFLDQL